MRFDEPWIPWAERLAVHAVDLAGLPPAAAKRLVRAVGLRRLRGRWRADPSGPLAAGSLPDIAGALASALYQSGVNWLRARDLAGEAVERMGSERDWTAGLVPLEGIADALRRFKAGGIRLAVVTADTTRGGEAAVDRLGLSGLVDVVLGADRVPASKPAPDLASAACAALGVEPARAAVAGDTPADLLMGQRAGVGWRVGVLSGAGRPRDLRPLADVVVNSLADLQVKGGERRG